MRAHLYGPPAVLRPGSGYGWEAPMPGGWAPALQEPCALSAPGPSGFARGKEKAERRYIKARGRMMQVIRERS